MDEDYEPPAKPDRTDGGHAASQIIFYAGKHPYMQRNNFVQIGKSAKFQDLFMQMCEANPTKMKILLGSAETACTEAESNKKRKGATVEKQPIKRVKALNRISRSGPRDPKAPSLLREEYESEFGPIDEECVETQQHEEHEDKDEEDEEEDTPDGDGQSKAAANDLPEQTTPEAQYQRELAIIRGKPLLIDENHCRAYVASQFLGSKVLNINSEYQAVLKSCFVKLDALVVKHTTIEHLQDLRKLSNTNTPKSPIVSDNSSTEEILEVLQTLSNIEGGNNIRTAYAQIMLYRSVSRRCDNKSAALAMLRVMARKKAANASDNQYNWIFKSYKKDYQAGMKWLNLIETFGGNGIVILFAVVRIGSSHVKYHWTKYQQGIVQSLGRHLHGIKKLVTALGPTALEGYCYNGCLDDDLIRRFEATAPYES